MKDTTGFKQQLLLLYHYRIIASFLGVNISTFLKDIKKNALTNNAIKFTAWHDAFIIGIQHLNIFKESHCTDKFRVYIKCWKIEPMVDGQPINDCVNIMSEQRTPYQSKSITLLGYLEFSFIFCRILIDLFCLPLLIIYCL